MNRVRQQLRFQRHALPIFVRSCPVCPCSRRTRNFPCKPALSAVWSRWSAFFRSPDGAEQSVHFSRSAQRRGHIRRHFSAADAAHRCVRNFVERAEIKRCLRDRINEPFARQFSSTQAIRSAHTRSSCPSICSKLPERLKYI